MFFHLLILSVSFAVVWFSSGYVVSGVEKFASRFKLSRFAVSVFVLGAVTSLPEMGVLLNSLWLNTPEVSLGNLVGGQMYILFFIIPLLTLFSRPAKLPPTLQGSSLIITLLVLGAPLMVLFDGQANLHEAWLLAGLYLIFILVYWQKMSLLERVEKHLHHVKQDDALLLFKILGNMGLILIASHQIVVEVHSLSNALNVHEFFMSMIIMALGTNTPELSLLIRGVVTHRSDVALGNYIGSAALNTLLMTLLILGRRGSVALTMNVAILVVFIVGIFCFWYVARSKERLSHPEGLVLLLFYLVFLGIGFFQEMGS